MKRRKRILIALVMALAAAVLIASGLLQVYRVYQHYRADILTDESRHLQSIVATSAGGLDWMLNGYAGELNMVTQRMEFTAAEEQYQSSKDQAMMRRLLRRRDIVRPDMQYELSVWDGETMLAATGGSFPAAVGDDEPVGTLGALREDDEGRFWFIVTKETESGLRYEMAVDMQTIFSYQAKNARVGRNGIIFLLDRDLRFMSYSGGGTTKTASVSQLMAENSGITAEALGDITAGQEGYLIYRYPWNGGDEETLVVTSPVLVTRGALTVAAAISFSEFDSYLSDTLHQVTWIILLEIGGALILLLMAAWVMIDNRRSALELDAVRERADLMEEINRQQQSLYHTERLQQLGIMTSGIVHEFNNMLTPVMGQSLLLLEQLADRDDSPEFEYALDVYESSEKARDMLRRMSSMGKKDVDMGLHCLELGALLKKTVNLSAMAKDSHIQQELILPKTPMTVLGNDQLLTQAFLNLCINGCQAMGDKGTLTVSAERQTLSGRPYAVVRVADTGPGIPTEALGSIYDPFFTTKGERGTGLGLAICKKIIESHKGTIVAANGETGGAVFTVQLPITEPEE